MASPYMAEIRQFAGNFAPFGWMFCHGQVLSIANYNALFALLGTTYGGDGITTVALSAGQGPGLSPRWLGEMGGAEAATLAVTQVPAHTHTLTAGGDPVTADPAGAGLPFSTSRVYSTSSPGTAMHAQSVGPAGGNQPHENMQPFCAIDYIICVEGIFPSRN